MFIEDNHNQTPSRRQVLYSVQPTVQYTPYCTLYNQLFNITIWEILQLLREHVYEKDIFPKKNLLTSVLV